MRKTISLVSHLVAIMLATAGSIALAEDRQEPLKLLSQDNELIGKIWSVAESKFIDKQQLLDAAYQSDYILLGETHDNVKHHEDHGWIIGKIAEHSKRTAVAFEMLNQDQEKLVNNVEFNNTGELLETLEQAKTGWEYKKYYEPVFDSVFKARLPMHAAEINRKSLMGIVKKGLSEAPEEVQALLKKTKLSDEATESLKKEIEMTHCGMINDEMTKAMMMGQKVRDAAIAETLYKMKQNKDIDTAVLVAGSGHIRKDRGAPFYLQAEDKNARITAIAWLEIEEEVIEPTAYSKRWGTSDLPFDFIVFTPGADRPDPCEEMKKYMDHKKNHGKKSS